MVKVLGFENSYPETDGVLVENMYVCQGCLAQLQQVMGTIKQYKEIQRNFVLCTSS